MSSSCRVPAEKVVEEKAVEEKEKSDD